MFYTKGNTTVALLLVAFISVTVALPAVDEEKLPDLEEKPLPASNKLKDNAKAVAPQGRYLIPAYFAVKEKKFSIGTKGVGSFFRAWRNCIEEGKSLATIETKEDQQYLEEMLEQISSDTNYWIGATNVGSSSARRLTWITTDLPVTTRPSYLSVNSANSCIALNSKGRWIRLSCFSGFNIFPYICEEYF